MSDSQNALVTVEDLFRSLSARLIATLVRILGTSRIDLAESVVQDAFLKACEIWPYKGVPQNPSGWITTVAKNRAFDLIRSENRRGKIAPEIARRYEELLVEGLSSANSPELVDDQLRMMMLTCHPKLSRRAQVSLTLNLCGGFSVSEIARAFLAAEDAVRRTISRAKSTIRSIPDPFSWPPETEIAQRIDPVLEVLYSIFNEGYSNYDIRSGTRPELCDEALRLTRLFYRPTTPDTKVPEVAALLALMFFQSARNSARFDAHGNPLLLEEQDRSLWDRERIALGFTFLSKSAHGEVISAYHHEARIAATHCISHSYEETRWDEIVFHYDELLMMTPNPVIALNRAVALANLFGVERGINELELRKNQRQLSGYYLYHATLGDFHRRLKKYKTAAEHYKRSLTQVKSEPERRFLLKRLSECDEQFS